MGCPTTPVNCWSLWTGDQSSGSPSKIVNILLSWRVTQRLIPVHRLQQLTGVTLQDSKIFTQEQTKNLPFWTETSSKIGKAAFASC